MRGIPWWVLLLGLVVIGTFYVGLSTDFLAFAKGAQQILYALSGRDQAGRAIQYPAGATLNPQYSQSLFGTP